MDHSPDPFHSRYIYEVLYVAYHLLYLSWYWSAALARYWYFRRLVLVWLCTWASLSLNWRQFHVFSSSAALSQRFPCCSSCFSTFCKVTLFQNLCSSRNYLPTIQLLPCYLQVHSKGHFCRKTLTEQFVAVSYSSQRVQLKNVVLHVVMLPRAGTVGWKSRNYIIADKVSPWFLLLCLLCDAQTCLQQNCVSGSFLTQASVIIIPFSFSSFASLLVCQCIVLQ